MCRVAWPGAEEDEAREGEDHQCPCDSSNPDPSDTDREERVEPERPNTGPSKIMQPLTHEAGKRIKTSENREPAEHREHRETHGFRACRAPRYPREKHGNKDRAGEEDQEKRYLSRYFKKIG